MRIMQLEVLLFEKLPLLQLFNPRQPKSPSYRAEYKWSLAILAKHMRFTLAKSRGFLAHG